MKSDLVLNSLHSAFPIQGAPYDDLVVFDKEKLVQASSDPKMKLALADLGFRMNAIYLSISGEAALNKSCIAEFLVVKAGRVLDLEVGINDEPNIQCLLLFSTRRLKDFVEKYDYRSDSNEWFEPTFKGRSRDFLAHWMSAFDSCQRFPMESKQKLIELKFEELLLFLFERTKAHRYLLQPNNEGQSMSSFSELMDSQSLSNLKLQELAAQCNMSVSTFKRHFVKSYGCSPMKWFMQRRMEYAAALLQQHGKLSSEIYELVGFQSVSAFTRSFKSFHGLTPCQYRKRKTMVVVGQGTGSNPFTKEQHIVKEHIGC